MNLAAITLALGTFFLKPEVTNALSDASIGSVVVGSRPGSTVGLGSEVVLPTLGYCITYTSDEQAMDYGHEVVDSNGNRPPYGGAFASAFIFVPQANWSAGEKLPARTVCNNVTLERGKIYTVRAWVTSGPLDTRALWAVSGPTAPLAASYVFTPTEIPTTTTTTTPTASSSGGSGGTGSSSAQCPSSRPIRTQVNGRLTCISLHEQCSANPTWSDPTRDLGCLISPTLTTLPAQFAATCNSSIVSKSRNRAVLRFATTTPLGTKIARFEVERFSQWFVLGSARPGRIGPTQLVTNSPVINERGTYRVRITRQGKTLCEGLLTTQRSLNLRGPVRPAF